MAEAKRQPRKLPKLPDDTRFVVHAESDDEVRVDILPPMTQAAAWGCAWTIGGAALVFVSFLWLVAEAELFVAILGSLIGVTLAIGAIISLLKPRDHSQVRLAPGRVELLSGPTHREAVGIGPRSAIMLLHDEDSLSGVAIQGEEATIEIRDLLSELDFEWLVNAIDQVCFHGNSSPVTAIDESELHRKQHDSLATSSRLRVVVDQSHRFEAIVLPTMQGDVWHIGTWPVVLCLRVWSDMGR